MPTCKCGSPVIPPAYRCPQCLAITPEQIAAARQKLDEAQAARQSIANQAHVAHNALVSCHPALVKQFAGDILAIAAYDIIQRSLRELIRDGRTQYKLRVGGSNDYVSKIDEHDRRCVPPGSVDYVPGYDHPDAIVFATEEEANDAVDLVLQVDGVPCTVESYRHDGGQSDG